MASTVWKGYISFGLVSVPIRLYAAARPEHVAFHEVHEVCGTRIKQQLYCPHCKRVVERAELVKGYELDKEHMVTVTEEEVKKNAPPSTDSMEITEFVKIDEVDPLYYESSYYALPEKAGTKAYRLLVQTLEKTGYVAVAKVGMHRREYVVVIRPRDHGLTLHTMYYPNEIRVVPGYGAEDGAKISAKEVALAEQLVKGLATHFKPENYRDEYQERLLKLVEAKGEGKQIKGERKPRRAPVIDLMQALKKSLAEKQAPKKPAAAAKSSVVSQHRRQARVSHG
jgi:DNA end-binding protein Ku